MSHVLLAIGEVSKRTGMPVKTLRFYADEGVVPPSGRSASGYRLYAEADIVKLELVRSLRDAGLGLDAIGRIRARLATGSWSACSKAARSPRWSPVGVSSSPRCGITGPQPEPPGSRCARSSAARA